MRVYELGKELNLDSRRLIDLLHRLGVEVKNHMSKLDDPVVQQVRDIVEGKLPEQPPAAKAPARTGQPPARTGQPPARTGQPPARTGQAPARTGQPPARTGQGPARPGQPPARTGQGPARPGQGPARPGQAPARPGQAPARTGGPGRKGGFARPGGPSAKRGPRRRPPREKTKAPQERVVLLDGPVTVQDLAERMDVSATEIIKILMRLGVMAAVNQEVDSETAGIVASEMGFQVRERPADQPEPEELPVEDEPAELESRPPVVTVMGHVDHGKTSLLDAIRSTNVTARESGGITQHIGAYTVKVGERQVVFLDTPGHEAFTAMRARGAKITDVAVLVVAADDGVMPQTIEAINHARAAGVPIVVAINKMDKPDANPDRVKQQLTEHGLVAEEWGGETVFVPVSARAHTGLEQLLEMILLVSDVQELKANPHRPARGTVVEAQLDRGRGPVATVLVQTGTLRVGDAFVVGTTAGRVRALVDDKGRRIKRAGPAAPVEVLGLEQIPEAGDTFLVVADEKRGREIADRRRIRQRERELKAVRRGTTLEDLFREAKEGEKKTLNLVVKGDVQGSVEALVEALEKLSGEEVAIRVIHHGVGAINESDVMLAAASGASVIGFHVQPDPAARKAAEREHVEIRTYRVIYEVTDDIHAAVTGMLEPTLREEVLGRAVVRQLFKVPKVGTVAGCYVEQGKLTRNATIRVLRDGVVTHEGAVASLKRFKEDVREVAGGFECGVGLERFNDLKEGDVLEAFQMQEVRREA